MEILKSDITALEQRGISLEKFREEIGMILNGFPFLRIECAATEGNGITVPSPEMIAGSIDIWDKFLVAGGDVEKMVPASGAASRMFKDLFSFLGTGKDKPDNDFMKQFFDRIEDFAFFPILNGECLRLYNKSALSLIKDNRYKEVVEALINKDGLNYGQLPKALLRFHKVAGYSRTALEEHLAEGALYAGSGNGTVKIHFTVSNEHVHLFENKIEEVKAVLESKYNVKYEITTSVQKPSTDTPAANMDDSLYREDGCLFFRPGGHGALIENLADLNSDVIFIKNIDNVVPDSLKDITVKYKKVIGGILVSAKTKIDEFCRLLKQGDTSAEQLDEMLHFLRNVLCVTHDQADTMDVCEKREYIFKKLNRPLRVCGMVKNEGEPGGGPFLVYSSDGTVQPQILESSQLDPKQDKKLLKDASHFNPVDLVVSIKDYKGGKFDLSRFVDKSTGFISIKSREGVKIKALELPGLWNGAMSDWNTIFVEVPVTTFNPVKTVNDLLRPMHQSGQGISR